MYHHQAAITQFFRTMTLIFLPFLGSCSRACRGAFRRTFMRLVSGFWLAAASFLLPPRLHTRLSFWKNARLLTTDGRIPAHPPGRGGPTDPRNAEGRGRREGGEEKQQQEGLGDGGSRTSVEGRSHSPARRSSLRSERSRAQLTARQKGSQRFALALSLGARCSRPSASSSYADITTRKTNVVYNNNFLPFLGSCSRACRGAFRRTFMRPVSGFWLAVASLLLPPRLHTRLSFWQMRGF